MAAGMNYEQKVAAAAHLAELDDDEANLPTAEQVVKKCSEWGIMAELKPHQSQGVAWLIRRYCRGVNVILGDEMGLGKTLQAICLMAYLKIERKRSGPFLVLCPLSVTDGWASEFARFSPILRVLRYVGDKEHRLEMRKEIFEYVSKRTSKSGAEQDLPFDVFLTTYDLAMLDANFISHIRWLYAIIDEAQRIKNPSSVLYTTLQECYMIPRRLLMTGTPVQNNLSELWALLHFCMPLVFGALEDFVTTFKKAAGDNASGDDKQVKLLRYIVHVFMLRRTKALLVQNGTLTLPPLSEVTVMAPLVPLQKKIYMSVLRKELPKLLMRSVGTSQHQSLQNIVVQLRKACSHPYLFGGVEAEPFEEGEHLVQASGKLLILDALLRKLHSDGHRVLIFSQMTRTLDILQDYLELRRYSYERLDGSVRAEERFAAVQSFSGKSSRAQKASGIENPDDDTNKSFVFLISTRAGGVGLNLVAADTVIFYEQDWNPQVDKQALQRAHRIGQLHHVLAISIVTENTVEEVIMCRAKRKLQLTRNVIGPDDSDLGEYGTEDSSSNDLRSMIIYGLHKFDPSEDVEQNSNETNYTEMKSMAEKILGTRLHGSTNMVDEKFKIDSRGRAKDVPLNDQLGNDARGRNRASFCDELEEARAEKRRKIEDKKLAKWEALGYKSLAVEDVSERLSIEQSSDSGEVQFVFGDCTHPIKCHPNEATIIFSCVDNSGNWGSGGMFDALSNISQKVPDTYGKAHECQDLHLGDLHLIPISGKCSDEQEQGLPNEGSQWVALAVVQTYNPRRKVPRSDISLDHLERCLKNASISAFQNSASIHMPRIGFRSTDKRTEWYAVERLLHKYSTIYGVKIYVYYFKRH